MHPCKGGSVVSTGCWLSFLREFLMAGPKFLPDQCALMVCSSDNTFDVAQQILPSHCKFWPDCPFPKYVLLTTKSDRVVPPGWQILEAGEPTGWRGELLAGLERLPSTVRHVVLFLDDFLLLRKVNTQSVVAEVGHAVAESMQYLRFVPLQRSMLAGLIRRVMKRRHIDELEDGEPYYSSLQLALWSRAHLIKMLQMPGSIWQFEHQRIDGVPHFAMRHPLISYVHVVEKGKWLPYARRCFQKAGFAFEPGSRAKWGWQYGLAHYGRKLKFSLVGYLVISVRAALQK